MRGKVVARAAGSAKLGITPAYAGKSLPKDGTAKKAEDPPRLCGEKVQRAARISVTSGSPPPMRGKGYL